MISALESNSDKNSHIFLGFSKTLLTSVGAWPLEIIKKPKRLLYNFYYKVLFYFFLFYLITELGGSVKMINVGTEEFAAITSILLGHISFLFKILIITSKKFASILNRIKIHEQNIRLDETNNNESVCKIYQNNMKISKLFEILNTVLFLFGWLFFSLKPMESYFSNTDGSSKLIAQVWFPFNIDEHHYWISYFIQVIGLFIGGAFGYYSQALMQSVVRFFVCQFEILGYKFKNFSSIHSNFEFASEKDHLSLLKRLIQDHQELLILVEDFNNCMQLAILAEFLSTSFQITFTIYTFFGTSNTSERIALSIYFTATNIQLLGLYLNADEMAFQSEKIAISIWESDWYRYSNNLIKIMQFVMFKAQKPVYIKIGAFGFVQFGALIQIYRTIYSYICLFSKQ